MGLGEVSALLAAGMWAAGSLLYGGIRLTAFEISLGKNVLAITVLLSHLLLESLILQRPMFLADSHAWWWLGLSGLVGIVIGDTCYFRSLQILGARRALMVSTTAPLFTVALGWVFLGESLTIVSVVGIIMTLLGVAVVVADRDAAREIPGLFPGTAGMGLFMGILGAACTAVGAVASRRGMQNCEPLEAAFIRILVSGVIALLVVTAAGRLKSSATKLASGDILKRLVPAILCGTWLGIWLSQIAYKHSTAAIANTLTCTTPLFALPMVRLIYGYPITRPGLIGTTISIIGIYLTVAG